MRRVIEGSARRIGTLASRTWRASARISARSKSKWIISISVARLRAATAAGSSAGSAGLGGSGGVVGVGVGGGGGGASGCAGRHAPSTRAAENVSASVRKCRFIVLLTSERVRIFQGGEAGRSHRGQDSATGVVRRQEALFRARA